MLGISAVLASLAWLLPEAPMYLRICTSVLGLALAGAVTYGPGRLQVALYGAAAVSAVTCVVLVFLHVPSAEERTVDAL